VRSRAPLRSSTRSALTRVLTCHLRWRPPAAAGRDAAADRAAAAAPAPPPDPAAALSASMVAEIAAFLTSRGGRASSDAVAAAFNARVNAAQAGLFRAALRQAATLEKEGGAAAWVLRAQYRVRPARNA
jgi:hypothetical protein